MWRHIPSPTNRNVGIVVAVILLLLFGLPLWGFIQSKLTRTVYVTNTVEKVVEVQATPAPLTYKTVTCGFTTKEAIPNDNLYIVRAHGGSPSVCTLRCVTNKKIYDLVIADDLRADDKVEVRNGVINELNFYFYSDGRVEREGFTCFKNQNDLFNYIITGL